MAILPEHETPGVPESLEAILSGEPDPSKVPKKSYEQIVQEISVAVNHAKDIEKAVEILKQFEREIKKQDDKVLYMALDLVPTAVKAVTKVET